MARCDPCDRFVVLWYKAGKLVTDRPPLQNSPLTVSPQNGAATAQDLCQHSWPKEVFKVSSFHHCIGQWKSKWKVGGRWKMEDLRRKIKDGWVKMEDGWWKIKDGCSRMTCINPAPLGQQRYPLHNCSVCVSAKVILEIAISWTITTFKVYANSEQI